MRHKFVIELTDDCKGYEQDVDYLERIYGAEHIKEHDEEIYNKALNDFVNVCKKQFATMYGQRYVDMRDIVNIAEQLKAGLDNDD